MPVRRILPAVLALACAASASAQKSAEVPGWDGDPYAGTLTLESGFSDDPRTIEVRPGGSMENPLSGPGCAGYIGQRPDVVVDYEAGSLFDLTFSVAAAEDVSLVVRAPDGRYYCDDDSGEDLNPLLTVEDPPSGLYRVWAGVYAASQEYVDGVVGVSEVGQAATLATASGGTTDVSTPARLVSQYGSTSGDVPGWSEDPYYGVMTLESGFSGDPRTIEVGAGGAQENPLDGPGCVGHIGLRPDAVVRYSAGTFDLTFSAAAGRDLNLVVRTPGGRYLCDDDGGDGTNPRVVVESPESGDYRVWVGTYAESEGLVDSRLGVSELGLDVE